MADTAINMQTNDAKAFNTPVLSLTMIAFHRLLVVFAKFTAAETRLEKPGVDVCSAAFGDDIRHAGAVRDALIETAYDVIAALRLGKKTADCTGLQDFWWRCFKRTAARNGDCCMRRRGSIGMSLTFRALAFWPARRAGCRLHSFTSLMRLHGCGSLGGLVLQLHQMRPWQRFRI